MAFLLWLLGVLVEGCAGLEWFDVGISSIRTSSNRAAEGDSPRVEEAAMLQGDTQVSVDLGASSPVVGVTQEHLGKLGPRSMSPHERRSRRRQAL
jgi:hypothetical protein